MIIEGITVDMKTDETERMIQEGVTGETTIVMTQGIEMDDVKIVPKHQNHDQTEGRKIRKATHLAQVSYICILYYSLTHAVTSAPVASASTSNSRPNLDPDAPDEEGEEGEEMDATNDDDAAMMAMMGMSGFGSTKACIKYTLASCDTDFLTQNKQVEGNQEGGVDVKKMRTWRQYMNRFVHHFDCRIDRADRYDQL